MDRVDRLRRVALLCVHFSRNCAYFRAGWDGVKSKAVDEFTTTVQSNFLDISVLEWVKLFGDSNDEHHWKNIVDDVEEFRNNMFNECLITEGDFRVSWDSMKKYRNQFVAHLDSEKKMNIPVLSIPLAVTKFYYKSVIDELEIPNIRNLPMDIESYHDTCFEVSSKYYQSINV